MSRADEIFISNMRDILDNGVWDTELDVRPKWSDGTPAHTVKKFGIVNRYNLQEEFPILTVRRTFFKSCIDELLWIWQKKSNNIKDLNSKIWNQWADANGSIGKAYGYQLGVKHKYKEGEFDQVDRVLFDLKNNTASRRIMTNIYNFAVQYAVLLIMFAQVSGLKAGELVHVIADAHIYDRHVPIVEEILKMPVLPAPKLEIDKSIKNFYNFTVDSFKLEEYKYNNKKYDIPVAE